LVEGGGLVGSLVEEGVVGDGGVDVEASAGDDGLFATCDRSHGQRRATTTTDIRHSYIPSFQLRSALPEKVPRPLFLPLIR